MAPRRQSQWRIFSSPTCAEWESMAFRRLRSARRNAAGGAWPSDRFSPANEISPRARALNIAPNIDRQAHNEPADDLTDCQATMRQDDPRSVRMMYLI